jgi:hypothetical protein
LFPFAAASVLKKGARRFATRAVLLMRLPAECLFVPSPVANIS